MAGTWERRGTVTVTHGSNVVVGAGTYWTDAQNGPQVGNTFYGPDGQAHEVAVIRSATELWLADEYKSATAAGAAYQIDTTRVDSVPGLASRVAAVLGFAQGQYDNLDKWTQGGADEDVTLTSPNGESVTVPSLPKMGKDYAAIGNALPAAERAEAAADRVDGKHAEVVSLAAQVSSDASATQSAKNTAVSASANAQSSATSAAGDAVKAEAAAVKAEQAAQTVVGALIDAGPYNASSGVLPAPVMSGSTKLSSIWKVTGNGVAGGIDLGIGDSLVYTSRDNSYYKIDNTESVSKVNGKTGVVVLTAADVGADPSGTALSVQLPAPDVSIPFCEDLEMSAGLGYDTMQIGADTLSIPGINLVAYQRLGSQTMIDKSGRLVTVGANRPAIEQQGIAIYDQSVNLAAPSINWSASANAAAPWVHGAVDEFGWRSVSGSGDTSKTEGSYKDFSVPTAGTPLTLSLDILKTTGLNVRIRTYGHESGAVDVSLSETAVTGAGGADVYDMGHYWRVELTRSFSGSTRLFRIYPFGTLAGSSGAMSYRRVQLEAKPFATPYIENETSAQTARPATTRCDIPWRGNMQPISDTQQLTIALEFDTAGQPSSGYHTLLANGSGSGNYLQIRVEAGGLLRAYRSASATHQPVVAAKRRYRLCYRVNRNTCDMFLDGVKFGSPVTVAPLSVGMPQLLRIGYTSITDRCLNGHLRSIAIWNAPLTDIQCQAASAP